MALTKPSSTMQLTMVWTSSRKCAGKRQTLQATIVTIFSHLTKDVSVFVKCDTSFRLCFWKLPQIRTSNFRSVVRQHTEGTSSLSFLACNSRLRSATRRHHPPQRAVLSQICCFGEHKVVLFQILFDGVEPRDAGTT